MIAEGEEAKVARVREFLQQVRDPGTQRLDGNDVRLTE